MDKFKQPLTAEQLREIGVRRDAADIIPLLWEIKRLRALVLRGNQLVQRIAHGDFLEETFRRELVGEPVVDEEEKRRVAVDLKAKPECDRPARRVID